MKFKMSGSVFAGRQALSGFYEKDWGEFEEGMTVKNGLFILFVWFIVVLNGRLGGLMLEVRPGAGNTRSTHSLIPV